MKSTYMVAFCAIVGITSANFYAMDFLNDPFFKQLASELDSMFGTTPAGGDQTAPHGPTKFPATAPFGAKQPAFASAENEASTTKVNHVADAAKDLKTLFIENVEPPKAGASNFGSAGQKQQKIIISKKRLQAYHFYMDDLVKKTRLIERIVSSNPSRIFGYRFLASFDGIVDSIDKIEIVHQLVLSKKMYLRNFFGQPIQKTRENIVALLPKIDTTLRKLRQLLNKEESLDDDIMRMQQEASRQRTSKKNKISIKPKAGKKSIRKNKIGRPLTTPKKFDWPKYKRSYQPATKSTSPTKIPAPEDFGWLKKKAPLPGDNSLKKFIHERGVS